MLYMVRFVTYLTVRFCIGLWGNHATASWVLPLREGAGCTSLHWERLHWLRLKETAFHLQWKRLHSIRGRVHISRQKECKIRGYAQAVRGGERPLEESAQHLRENTQDFVTVHLVRENVQTIQKKMHTMSKYLYKNLQSLHRIHDEAFTALKKSYRYPKNCTRKSVERG